MHIIQSVSGGKLNILGGHCIRHSKKKKLYTYMCPIPNGSRDRAISLNSSKVVDKKVILRTVLIPVFTVQVIKKLLQFTWHNTFSKFSP
jgi:hypothetical protein